MPTNPHEARDMAESFGVDAERYDRARQDYPAALIARIVETSPGPDVLDVGTGTGIVARQLQAAGCHVLGVEPDARMASFARKTGVSVEVAKFEDWDPAGRSFDAVVAGQAWHWVDPAAGAALTARVLRPGGLFSAFWHATEAPAEVTQALGTAINRVLPDFPFNLQAMNERGLDMYNPFLGQIGSVLEETGEFEPAEEWRFTWERPYTSSEWLDQVRTTGGFTRLPATQVAEIVASAEPALDALGPFTVRYATVAVSARRGV